MALLKKTSPRRTQVRKTISAERSLKVGRVVNTDTVVSSVLWLLFVLACIGILAFELIQRAQYTAILPLASVVLLASAAAALYVCMYQKRILRNRARALALVGMLVLLLLTTKLGALATRNTAGMAAWGTATATVVAVIITMAYDQRSAMGTGLFYSVLAYLAIAPVMDPQEHQLRGVSLLLTMAAAVLTCCYSLREIRTRTKLLEVGALAAAVVFATTTAAVLVDLHGSTPTMSLILKEAGYHGAAVLLVGLLIQSLLPLIEKIFRIATSMTLLDYSDANQPLLKRLAMEAPGTFSHSLLIGSIAEAAAEAIGCSGLLCRVGAYYHDIGKINKPKYFVENEMGSASKHKELSPAMSQLIIVGHVKDGAEMAKEYNLPSVLRQFVETHHGTTLVEPFYNEAKKKHEAPASATGPAKKPKEAPPAESEFRYTGPKPRSKEAAIVMLADAVEGAVRSLTEVTPARVETVVHNIAMKRLQDGQFDECDLTLRELSQIESSMAKSLAAHYHARIAYPTPPDAPQSSQTKSKQPVAKGT